MLLHLVSFKYKAEVDAGGARAAPRSVSPRCKA